jgi:hypothetical protein
MLPSVIKSNSERQGAQGSQHQGLHDDWWHYYEYSNERADQYWPQHQDIMMPTKKGKEQAEPITVYTAIPNMAESLKSNKHHPVAKQGCQTPAPHTTTAVNQSLTPLKIKAHIHVHDQQQIICVYVCINP